MDYINLTDYYEKLENIIITGSFLEKGFKFRDIDIIIIKDNKIENSKIQKEIEESIGIKAHIIKINNEEMKLGLETDPLYQMMLSKCVAKKRFIYKIDKKINYKLLDLHLLHSKTMIENFDILDGYEKYNLTRNLIAIYLYINGGKITKELIDKKIIKILKIESIDNIKNNILDKKSFLKNYKKIYEKTSAIILSNIKNDTKQK